jgi:hypothetical protein
MHKTARLFHKILFFFGISVATSMLSLLNRRYKPPSILIDGKNTSRAAKILQFSQKKAKFLRRDFYPSPKILPLLNFHYYRGKYGILYLFKIFSCIFGPKTQTSKKP